MGCTTDVGLLLVVRLVAILGGMVVGRMAEGLSLMAPEKCDLNGRRRQTEPTSAGRVGFFGAFGTFRAGHGGHGLGGGGHGGGCGSGGGRATYFAGVLSPGVVRGGAIKRPSWPSSKHQAAPLLAKVDIGCFCLVDRWAVRFFWRYFISLFA
jgi:hypothetical protein